MGERIKGFTKEYIEEHTEIQIQQYEHHDKGKVVSIIVHGFFKGIAFVGDCEQSREGELVQQLCRMLPLAFDSALQWGDLDYHWANLKEICPQLFE